MKASFTIALLWLALIAPAHSRNITSTEKTESLPPESCAPPALSRQELSVAAKDDGELRWNSDITGALKTAKEQHQEVLIYFRAKRCTACDKLHAEVLSDTYIQTRIKAFVLVRIDIQAAPDATINYGIATVPAVVRLSKNGVVLKKLEGWLDKDDLLTFLRSY